MIVSLVRSNSEGEVGFLSEKRRLNGELRNIHTYIQLHCFLGAKLMEVVAMTRPKRSLVVVGDSETVRRYVALDLFSSYLFYVYVLFPCLFYYRNSIPRSSQLIFGLIALMTISGMMSFFLRSDASNRQIYF